MRFVDFEIPEGGRLLVCSDVHANPGLLDRLLERAGYRPGEDCLALLGDYIEKGPDSPGAFRQARRLSENRNTVLLRGNVDRWFGVLFSGDYAAAAKYTAYRGDNILTQLMREYGIGELCEENYRRTLARFAGEFGEAGEWFRSLPVAARTREYAFAHSGIPAEGDWLSGSDEDYTSNYGYYKDPRNTTGRLLFVGHIPTYYLNSGTDFAPYYDRKNDVYFIDGGTNTYARQLNMLIVTGTGDSRRVEWICEDGLPEAVAVRREEGDMSGLVKITERNKAVEVLERGRDFSLVRCAATGQTGLAKNEMISGGVFWGELSAFLHVEKGERLKIALDGMSGWTYVKKADGSMGFLPNDAVKKL